MVWPSICCQALLLSHLALFSLGLSSTKPAKMNAPLASLSRRQSLIFFISAPLIIVTPRLAYADNEGVTAASITLPIIYQPSLSAYTTTFKLEGSEFTAVVDTGSPFLTVKGDCDRVWSNARGDFNWGCWKGEGFEDSALRETVEQYGSREGSVSWRRGELALGNATNGGVAFGIVDSKVGVCVGRSDNTSVQLLLCDLLTDYILRRS